MIDGAAEISVIIPVHNGEKYLAQSIQSVLDQDHPAIEILIIDNASTDASAEIAQGFPFVRYFYLEERGLANALNHGVEHGRGAYLGFLDSDDLWTAGKLAAQLAAFDRNPTIDMVFGHIEQFISPELDHSVKATLTVRQKKLPGYLKTSMLIKTQSFWQVGLFDTSIELADFVDWCMRAREQSLKELMLPEVLALRRIHESNMGYTHRGRRNDYVRIIKRGLDRRRQLPKR